MLSFAQMSIYLGSLSRKTDRKQNLPFTEESQPDPQPLRVCILVYGLLPEGTASIHTEGRAIPPRFFDLRSSLTLERRKIVPSKESGLWPLTLLSVFQVMLVICRVHVSAAYPACACKWDTGRDF